MKRQYRTLLVMVVAVATAGLAAFGVYQAIQQMPIREVEVGTVNVVVAAEELPVGTRLRAEQLKVVAWPAKSQLAGAYAEPKGLVDRGVIATISPNEPVTESKVASLEAGAGLPPIIPPGMRAMSVKVNEVIGVAGFVVPGTRVDVLVSMQEKGDDISESIARTVVSNVQVLTAGTKFDQEQAKQGKPQPSSVVTLAVLPEDGERIALASAEGKLSLALRNPMDVEPTQTSGIKLAALMRGTGPEPKLDETKRRMVPVRRAAALPPPPQPEPKPAIYTVETIRAAKRGEEVVR